MERNGKRTERPLPQNAGAQPRNTARNRSAAPQNMRVRAGGRRRKRGPNRGCFVVVLLCLLAALLIQGILSILLGLLGAGCLWSIRELKEQAKRVERGWFPKNPKRK